MSSEDTSSRRGRARVPPGASLEIDIAYRPAETVSGDLYDVSFVREDVLRVLIADATGHGVRAALATMFIRSEYEHTKRECRDPTHVLSLLNQRLARSYDVLDMRFTALCADVDTKSGAVVYAAAAHPAPWPSSSVIEAREQVLH